MKNWILPFIITVVYTVFTIIIGILPSRKIDMNKTENWGTSGNTMGTMVLIFLLGGSMISAYTFMGAPGWAYSKGVGILYVSVYLALMQLVGYLINPRIVRLAKEKNITTQSEAFGLRCSGAGLCLRLYFIGVLCGGTGSRLRIYYQRHERRKYSAVAGGTNYTDGHLQLRL